MRNRGLNAGGAVQCRLGIRGRGSAEEREVNSADDDIVR